MNYMYGVRLLCLRKKLKLLTLHVHFALQPLCLRTFGDGLRALTKAGKSYNKKQVGIEGDVSLAGWWES